MGIYANTNGELKIEPELNTEELHYYRSRFYYYIMSSDWRYMDTEEEALEWCKKTSENFIKNNKININPYNGISKTYLEFLTKMFGNRISGKVEIQYSTTYGNPNVDGGWTNNTTVITIEDGKLSLSLT